MKIKIKESQYTKLNEAVGVPTNIVEISKQLYDKMMSELNPNKNLRSLFKKEIELKGDFQINDYEFKKIILSFNIEDINDYNFDENNKPKVSLNGMTHHGRVKLNSKFNYDVIRKMNKIELSITFIVDNDTTVQDVIDEFKKERTLIVSSLAHEMKHAYDDFAKSLINTQKRVDYHVGTKRGFGYIGPLNALLNYMYFVHTTENLVRATELYAALEESGITKKDFYKFITNNKVYENYRKAANLTYEGLKEDLKSVIPQIKQTFDENNIDYPKDATDDEMVEHTLQEYFKTLLKWKAGTMRDFLTNDYMESFFGFRGAKQKYFDNYLSKITRFGGDYERYFRYEINQINTVSFKMMKKLSKLYSLIKDKNPQQ
jgi:hypothetical protein